MIARYDDAVVATTGQYIKSGEHSPPIWHNDPITPAGGGSKYHKRSSTCSVMLDASAAAGEDTAWDVVHYLGTHPIPMWLKFFEW